MIKPIWLLICCLISVGTAYATRHHHASPSSNSITFSALPAYNWLNYHKPDTRSLGDFDIGAGLTYRSKPITGNGSQGTGYLQLAIGVNYRKYHGAIDLHGLTDSVHLAEPAEEHKFVLYQTFSSTEAQSVTYIEPDIRLEYVQPLSSAIEFVGGLGVAYGINFAESNEMTSGSYQSLARYYEHNNHPIHDLPSVNLGTHTDFFNLLPGATFKHSLFALGGMGFRFRLSPRWLLLTTVNVQYSLLNIQAKQDVLTDHRLSYSGIVANELPQGVRAISAGLEIGLSHRFEKSQKPARRHPPMHGAYCPY